MSELLQVGVITSPHGLQGEVKVFPITDNVQQFKKLKEIVLDTGKEKLTLEISGVKFFKKFVILKFKGIDDINDVEKYRQKELLIKREQAVQPKKDEYFIVDLIGVEVFTEDGEQFGVLKDVMQTGANDVYVISTTKHGEVLVPAIKDCILNVDIENKRLDIHLLDGLI